MKSTFPRKNRVSKGVRLIAFSVLAACAQSLQAESFGTFNALNVREQQEIITVKGTVKDGQDGLPLPGVTITDQTRRALGATGANGEFNLRVPKDAVLFFNMIGYATAKHVAAAGNQSLIISMSSNSNALNEVVVTALGIEREEKSLGYGITKVEGEAIADVPSNNWSDALKGKVPGLTLTQGGSGPFNSTRINLRGDRSLKPNGNDALIVIDGVPMTSGTITSGVNDAYGAVSAGGDNDVPVDFGNGVSDLNPDDIESVTVLKGAAAAALYGSRANNGALIITTKSGKARKGGLGISFNSNSSFNDVLRWPDYQYEYGQGNNNRNAAGELYYSYGASEDGVSTGGTSSAWGPKFNGQSYFQYDPATGTQGLTRTPWIPYEDGSIKDFWRTGSTFQNSLSLDGGNDRFTARGSLTHTKNEWIMPNTGFERMAASLNTSMELSDKLQLNGKFSYTNKSSDNVPGTGYNNQSVAYFMILQNPSIPVKWYEPRWQQGQEQIQQIHPFSSYIENPYLIAHEMTNGINSHNIDGNLQGIYTFNDKWNVMFRSGLSSRQDQREMRRTFDTANFPLGYYKQQDVSFFESNTDAMLTFKDKIVPKLGIQASLGGNLMSRRLKENGGIARGLLLPGVYKLSNALTSAVAENELIEKKVNSVYGLMNFGWDDKVFVDITGRNDWSSTLPDGNNSYFYPSVSSSYIISDIFTLPRAISFAKLRLSWAQVGSDTDPYQTRKYYNTSVFPGSADAPSVLHNANLKPERTESWEGGVNFALFNSRIDADVNLYQTTTKNQVLSVPLDVTTGFSQAWINGGVIRNRGAEVMLNARPVVSKDFGWTSTITWSMNRNKVLKLSEDVEGYQQIIASSGAGAVQTIVTKNGSTGDLWGFGLVRNEDGQVIFNQSTGLALRPTEKVKIGNAYADWKGGFNNEFRYKNWKLSALIDGQYGGIVYSQTHHKLTETGKLRHTLAGREEGKVVGEGVVLNADGSYSPNTTKVNINTWYSDYYRRANVETNSFDASYLKLREVRLEFNLPKSILDKARIAGASVALYGRDLAVISDFPIFDPETAAFNGSSIMPGVEMGQMPSTRTFGLNLRLTL
ncbi:TonB-linked SusC/RagA family outer membrane protein [Arcticibacter pallidicorallinus]|uniref:TonB-linked SusC/RagA family outer membrane protein n=1 Tax=Arcticibacter pallidicorallinus TaxID=1259464 RepID=A0A2T0UBA5_9SPHI|nr:SusC/RagA family TonB-linked outer membrane protein [Arcticibacter pallidicorallinus]PRY55193.1 TonB-linked SusC/RagA family outer membrane protein [Arcticibacter pallidicorallinus]